MKPQPRGKPASPFNYLLAQAREERGLSINDIVRRTGFTRTFARSYESTASNPTVTTLCRYAKALGVVFTIGPAGVSAATVEGDALLTQWVPRFWGDGRG